jgi:arsenate reductase-like glutaredoxin family protein
MGDLSIAIKIYEYAGCSTCKKALAYLDARKKKYEKAGIMEQPPTVSELKAMLGYFQANSKTFKNLFNTSGEQYRGARFSGRNVRRARLSIRDAKKVKLPPTGSMWRTPPCQASLSRSGDNAEDAI